MKKQEDGNLIKGAEWLGNNHSYGEMTKRKAFELYCALNENITELHKETNIPVPTLRAWKAKYRWDDVIKKEMANVGISLAKKVDEFNEILDEIESAEDFLKVSDKNKEFVGIPAGTVRHQVSEVDSEKALSEIAKGAFLTQNIATLKIIESKLIDAIETTQIRPKTWKEVLETVKFLDEAYEKIALKLNIKDDEEDEYGEMFFNHKSDEKTIDVDSTK